MGGILLSGISDVSRGSQLALQSGEGNREWEGTQAVSGGEDTCPHITSLLTSSDPRGCSTALPALRLAIPGEDAAKWCQQHAQP